MKNTKYKFWILWSPDNSEVYSPKKKHTNYDEAVAEAKRIVGASNGAVEMFIMGSEAGVFVGPRPVVVEPLFAQPDTGPTTSTELFKLTNPKSEYAPWQKM